MYKSLKEIIELFIKTDPNLHSKSVEWYLNDLTKTFRDLRPEAINYAISVCLEKELYRTKHISYFKAIAINQDSQMNKEIKLEEKRLGSLPNIFRVGEDD